MLAKYVCDYHPNQLHILTISDFVQYPLEVAIQKEIGLRAYKALSASTEPPQRHCKLQTLVSDKTLTMWMSSA